jgi:hypothetical protein
VSSERVTGSCGRFSLCSFFACFVAAQRRARLGTQLVGLAYLQNGALYVACAAYTLFLAPTPLKHLPAEASAATTTADQQEALLYLGCAISE